MPAMNALHGRTDDGYEAVPATTDQPPPLLHARLAPLDPLVHGQRRSPRRGFVARIGVIASTIGAAFTITFAAHALQTPAAARTASEPVASGFPAEASASGMELRRQGTGG
jgi:hypothetical protein